MSNEKKTFDVLVIGILNVSCGTIFVILQFTEVDGFRET